MEQEFSYERIWFFCQTADYTISNCMDSAIKRKKYHCGIFITSFVVYYEYILSIDEISAPIINKKIATSYR